MKFAVVVTFKIFAHQYEEFLRLMYKNAASSLELEEGCLQFDVCIDEACPNEVFLYEIYTSPDAFSLHLKSHHFIEFDDKVSSMIQDKTVKTFRTVN
jgi:quinol monooxygenase YgiN